MFSSSRFEIKKYRRDQIIHLQNEICSFIEIILEGRVAVQKFDKNGNVLTVNVLSAPDIIGAHLVFSTNNRYPMTITSATNTVILRLPKGLILEWSQLNLSFIEALLKAISDRILTLADTIKTISYKTIRQQIIAFLTYEYHIQKSLVIKLNYSKKQLAERLGVQRSSLSRELNKMRRDGLLEYDAKTITIKNIKLENNKGLQ